MGENEITMILVLFHVLYIRCYKTRHKILPLPALTCKETGQNMPSVTKGLTDW